MTIPRAILTVGLPACGKSTYAKQLLVATPGLVELNLDALRHEVSGDESDQSATRRAIALRNRRLNGYAARGQDVILSDTHARRRHRIHLTRRLRELGFQVELAVFDVGAATCRARNAARGRQVSEFAMQLMETRLRLAPPLPSEADVFTRVTDPGDPLWPSPAGT